MQEHIDDLLQCQTIPPISEAMPYYATNVSNIMSSLFVLSCLFSGFAHNQKYLMEVGAKLYEYLTKDTKNKTSKPTESNLKVDGDPKQQQAGRRGGYQNHSCRQRQSFLCTRCNIGSASLTGSASNTVVLQNNR